MKRILKLSVTLCVCAVNASADGTAFTEESAAAYLHLTLPVNVLFAGKYMEGGSVAVSLSDAVTNELHVFEDYSIASRLAGRTDIPEELRNTNDVNTTGRIYIGKDKPTRGGRLTSEEDGKRIKAAMECLAIAWLEREFTPGEQARMMEVFQSRMERRETPATAQIEKSLLGQKEGDGPKDRWKKTNRFESAMYVAARFKGLAPQKKKAETQKNTP